LYRFGSKAVIYWIISAASYSEKGKLSFNLQVFSLSVLRLLPPTATPIPVRAIAAAIAADQRSLMKFKRALTNNYRVVDCHLAASARFALYILVRTLHETRTDSEREQIIIPAYTCPSVVAAIVAARMRPIFCEINPSTLAFDERSLSSHLGRKTLAVICVHQFGIPHRLDTIAEQIRNAGAYLVEDAAQAMGSTVHGQAAGTVGDFGLFSFGPGKPLALAGGGAITVNSNVARDQISQVWAGITEGTRMRSLFSAFRYAALGLITQPLSWRLVHVNGPTQAAASAADDLGERLGMVPSQAAAGSLLLADLDGYNSDRRQTALRLKGILSEHKWVTIPETPQSSPDDAKPMIPIYLRLPVIVADEQRKRQLVAKLWRAGIHPGTMYGRSLDDVYPRYSTHENPAACHVASNLITLPTHHHVGHEDVEKIEQVFRSV
jgi:perosamine synthetase